MRSAPPTNLTEKAIEDLEAILYRSAAEYDADHVHNLTLRLYARCNDIATGLNLGHTRPDVPDGGLRRFLTVHPFVIAYNPGTRRVVRIVDGRRDFTRLFR